MQRVRLFPAGSFTSANRSIGSTIPRWIATSSTLGITVIATPDNQLISFTNVDIHRLITNRSNVSIEVTDIGRKAIHNTDKVMIYNISLSRSCFR